MKFKRNIIERFNSFIRCDKVPSLCCPYCNKWSLNLPSHTHQYTKNAQAFELPLTIGDMTESEGVLNFLGTVASNFEHAKYSIAKVSGFFVCAQCEESVSFCGQARFPKDTPSQGSNDSLAEIYPQFFFPPIDFIEHGECTPEHIKKELKKSFALYFSDPRSSGNRLRVCIEKILNDLGFPEFETDENGNPIRNEKGKVIRRSLHARIDIFSKSKPRYTDMLLALKILGNESSHNSSSKITRKDILDAYEIVNYLIEEFYDKEDQEERIKRLSGSINEKYKDKG